MIPQSAIKYQVQVIELQPTDKILALFDPEWIDVENAQNFYQLLCDSFPTHLILGLYGTDIKIIREEDNNAEDNFKKHLFALREDTQT